MTPSERTTPLLSVIVPVFNEAATLADVLRSVRAAAYVGEVIVVDDGSTDGTPEAISDFILQIADWDVGFNILRHGTNRGKGAAIRSGLAVAHGEYTIIQDADLEYDPADFPPLMAPLLAGEADVVYGSRYLGGCALSVGSFCQNGPDAVFASAGVGTRVPSTRSGSANRSYWLFRWGVGVLNGLVRLLYGVRLTDEATCYKVFRTSDLVRMDLQCTGFEFCPEVTAKACRMGLRICEVPISYSPRRRKDGKKVRWRDGMVAVRELWRWRKWSPAGRGTRQVVPVDGQASKLHGGAAARSDERVEYTHSEVLRQFVECARPEH